MTPVITGDVDYQPVSTLKDEHFEQHLGLSIHSLLRQSWQQITKNTHKHVETHIRKRA